MSKSFAGWSCPWCWDDFETMKERNQHSERCGVPDEWVFEKTEQED